MYSAFQIPSRRQLDALRQRKTSMGCLSYASAINAKGCCRSRGFQVSAKEALLKQIRGLQGTGWQKDALAFHTYAEASLQLCQLHMELMQKGQGTGRDLASARMHLRTTLKQAVELQSEDGLFEQLQGLLAEVENLEAAHKHEGS